MTPGPADWKDLLSADYRGAVAIPDPGFAGSAFGALGYFSQAAELRHGVLPGAQGNGAAQVKAPDDVTTGVAEGRFKAGMTLDNSARTAVGKGSPVALVWPAAERSRSTARSPRVAASDNLAAADRSSTSCCRPEVRRRSAQPAGSRSAGAGRAGARRAAGQPGLGGRCSARRTSCSPRTGRSSVADRRDPSRVPLVARVLGCRPPAGPGLLVARDRHCSSDLIALPLVRLVASRLGGGIGALLARC